MDKTTIEDMSFAQPPLAKISESNYEQVNILLEAVRAFERSTYQCIYVVDYFKEEILYASNNFARLCGCDAAEIKNIGIEFFQNYVIDADLKMLIETKHSGRKLFDTLPIAERKGYTITCDFRIKYNGQNRSVSSRLTPLLLKDDGVIWIALCTISLASNSRPGSVFVKWQGANVFYEYSFETHQWISKQEVSLSIAERNVLVLSAQGYTINEISTSLCKAVDTVKTYRRSIFKKMNVRNISEAVAYALNHQLM